MQKSAHPQFPAQRLHPVAPAARDDKGQKFEPFWSMAIHNDRRCMARVLKADQKR
ncbi:hypothetical protein [Ideonella paludis]|uniref:Uncharacterized protein n=1 Tax=Ideonella paludis TaxID=1233411 RepID=A0ABS5DZ49_9BURK|nr:hypothetical protein [Ideonella paludis]MBQ0936414.1 hypothetical protein [Ideonella paludis]